MEDEPPIDAHLRFKALQQAIGHCAGMPHTFSPQEVVSIATIFYQFLKGETK